ncbi:hypothetical protein [Terasakiella pusilla]|uniref:hypothetical protein n=1 Tax=Terasakiella pusilla TaxID=64973 RepID=UPI003AA90674
MFAHSENGTSFIPSGKKFHRYVRPVTSQLNLKTILKLFQIDQTIVGEIENDDTALIVRDNKRTRAIEQVVAALDRGDECTQLYDELEIILKGQHLYATVFITEYEEFKTNTLILATGLADNKITYISVTEALLLQAIQDRKGV